MTHVLTLLFHIKGNLPVHDIRYILFQPFLCLSVRRKNMDSYLCSVSDAQGSTWLILGTWQIFIGWKQICMHGSYYRHIFILESFYWLFLKLIVFRTFKMTPLCAYTESTILCFTMELIILLIFTAT